MFRSFFDRLAGGGSTPRRRRRAIRSRVAIPSVVPQLPDVLRRLRALRDDLDYYVEQDGWILLLARDPNKPRVHEARRMLELGLDTFDNRIMADGFSILQMLEPHAVWSGEMLRCAQSIVDQATQRRVDAAHAERLREADGTNRDIRGEAHLRDRLTSEAHFDHRFFFRGLKSVSGDSRLADREKARQRANNLAIEHELRRAAARESEGIWFENKLDPAFRTPLILPR